MGSHHVVPVFFGVFSAFLFLALAVCAIRYWKRRAAQGRRRRRDLMGGSGGFGYDDEYAEEGEEDLVVFPGGEDLTVHGILDAPGEVVGKSSYGTLYKASMQTKEGKVGGNAGGGCGVGAPAASLMLLRFVRPACVGRTEEIYPAVQLLGFIRHPNLVPLRALYVGPSGEKLFVHPFYQAGSLAEYLKERNADDYKWEDIYDMSLGIARGLDHLHHALLKPVIHGNLKSKNILLDTDFQPLLSDYGLHLLLNPTAAQEMLESSASQGYKAPELIKMKDACRETDIYSMGVIFLEMLTRKEPRSSNLLSSWELHLPTSIRNIVLENKVSEISSPELLNQSREQNTNTEERLVSYFQLAMACCSHSPSLRPETKYIMRKLEEIGK